MRRALGFVWAWLLLAAGALPAQVQEGSGVLTLEAQARRALASGDHAAAAEAYAALARAEPSEVKWVTGTVEAMARGGRYSDALEVLDGARERFPEAVEPLVLTAKVNMLRAESLATGGRRDTYVVFAYEEAADGARKALARDAGNRDARLILAEALYALGELDAALAEGRTAAERFKDHPGGHLMVAKVMFQRFVTARQRITAEAPQGKALEEIAATAAEARSSAVAAIEAAIAADGDRAFPHKLLGDLHAWNGNPAQALAAYGNALAIDPTAAVDHGWLASHAEPGPRAELYRTALVSYERRPDASPTRAALLRWYLGKTAFEQKAFAQARDLMRAAVRDNPEYVNSLYYVWLSSYWLGEHEAAEREAAAYARVAAAGFADLLRTLPDRGQTMPVLEFLAAQAFQAKRLAASREINHVLALVQDSAQAWNNYAFLCRDTGRAADSLTAYERALELEPDSPQLLNDTAVILHYHLPGPDNLARARSMYERAVTLADQQLAAGGLDAPTRARLEQARKDAHANLVKMAGG